MMSKLPEEFNDAREAAQLISAAEFDELEHQVQPTEENSGMENPPIFTLTPTGGSMNRVLIAGTLTEVVDTKADEDDNEYYRARIVGPTGTFFAYAGQYQEEALPFLREAAQNGDMTPSFVMCVGKVATYENGDGEVNSKVTPEWITTVSGAARDQWVVEMANATMDRIEVTLRDDDAVPGKMPRELFHAKQIDLGDETVMEYLDPVIEALESVDESQANEEAAQRVETPADAKAEAEA